MKPICVRFPYESSAAATFMQHALWELATRVANLKIRYFVFLSYIKFVELWT